LRKRGGDKKNEFDKSLCTEICVSCHRRTRACNRSLIAAGCQILRSATKLIFAPPLFSEFCGPALELVGGCG
jgi:hypothetical protein